MHTRNILMGLIAALSLADMASARGAPVAASDTGVTEIIVTANKREAEGYDANRPVIGLVRTADFAVQPVVISGDTRDAGRRHEEIYAMIAGALNLAKHTPGVELAYGDALVQPLTLDHYKSLTLARDNRPDTDKAEFLVKVKLGANVDAKAALQRIDAYIKAVQPVGRAEIRTDEDLTLSVVNPDQYRAQIVDLIAADAHATASKLGPNYGVEARGLDRPVEWARYSLSQVFLYVPYTYVVRPAQN